MYRTAFDSDGDGVGCFSSGVKPNGKASHRGGIVGSCNDKRAVFSARPPIRDGPWASVPSPADLNRGEWGDRLRAKSPRITRTIPRRVEFEPRHYPLRALRNEEFGTDTGIVRVGRPLAAASCYQDAPVVKQCRRMFVAILNHASR